MNTEILRRYARLIAVSGLNVQPGQQVNIRTAMDQPEFVDMLVEECYKAGAGKVTIDWRRQEIQRLHIQYQSAEALGSVEAWEEEKLRHKAEILPADVYLASDDPDGLAGIDSEKWANAQRAIYKVTKPYRDSMENKYQWCVAAVPGVKWARKVFPGLDDDAAVEKLWELILKCSRADGADPIADWKAHDGRLRSRCEYLNSLGLTRLYYKSETTGTDFNVGLIPECMFMGGDDVLPNSDVRYNANIPTEEVFTTPMRGDVEGLVCATMPLSYRGVLIDDFSLRFEKGRVTEVHAGTNEDALRLMVSMDEGACMLGECALVPFESPIRESGVLFYNTLFDENASCHLALGHGYSICLKNSEEYSTEQAEAMGVNQSIIHEDFMIGAADLSITGLTDKGELVPIFVNGTWAF